MQKLPPIFKKYGFTFQQSRRTQHAAIYAQIYEEKVICYEVVRIKVAPKKEVFGKVLPLREVYPSSEQWGANAWTISRNQFWRALGLMRNITENAELEKGAQVTAITMS